MADRQSEWRPGACRFGRGLAGLVCALAVAVSVERSSAAPAEVVARVLTILRAGVADGQVVGAQVAIGGADAVEVVRQYGLVAPQGAKSVDEQTLFCIGSCSKPFAATCVLTLVDRGQLTLDEPIDRWAAEFSQLRDAEGRKAARAPTMRELMAHRGGIYTQRRQLSPVQVAAIRNFRLSLSESVDRIAQQPLITVPGEAFHYSGAGYCVLGYVAERATGRSIEQLLQAQLCKPLRLSRTTYFPVGRGNIAEGGGSANGPADAQRRSPHRLGDELKLPLVGGSVYSTASETAELARLMLNGGRRERQTLLTPATFRDLTRPQFEGRNYALGWFFPQVQNGRAITMIHNGALYSYRSLVFVHLRDNFFVVAHWTLSDPGNNEVRQQLDRAVLRQPG